VRGQGLAGAQRRLRGLSPEGRLALDALATRIVAEFLHLPTLRLHEAAASPEGIVYARAVHGLFGTGEDRR
jgi:glutamyl-tRNA reductase